MNSHQKKKTVLKTIRIADDLDAILQKDAKAKRMNVNALISSILGKYAEWDRYVDRFGGMVTLRQEALKSILELADDTAIVNAGKEAGSRFQKEFLLFWFKKIDVDAYLEFLSLICRYAGVGHYELDTDGKEYIVTLIHNMGEKWSLYLSGTIGGGIRTTIGVLPKFEVTKSSLIIRFTVS